VNWWAAMLVAWAVAAAAMAALWWWCRRRRNAGWVDVAWSLGTGTAGAFLALAVGGVDHPRAWLVAATAAGWGLRLGLHLAVRIAGEPEDSRYADLRQRWGDAFDRRMFAFFQIQASWVVLFATPMMVAAGRPGPLDWMDMLGVGILLAAVAGETVADRQLAAWKRSRPEGELVCRRGLWSWSRHPNYFFEWTHWFGYVAIGIAGPYGWITLAGPALMYVFLTRITGVPVAERRSVARRGEAYLAYQREVPAFLPRPPRRGPRASSES
jgi:steroid 5-alpha reductase family enzyme